jgi:hypothetical protein
VFVPCDVQRILQGYTEDAGSTFLRNIYNHLPDYAGSPSRKRILHPQYRKNFEYSPVIFMNSTKPIESGVERADTPSEDQTGYSVLPRYVTA